MLATMQLMLYLSITVGHVSVRTLRVELCNAIGGLGLGCAWLTTLTTNYIDAKQTSVLISATLRPKSGI